LEYNWSDTSNCSTLSMQARVGTRTSVSTGKLAHIA